MRTIAERHAIQHFRLKGAAMEQAEFDGVVMPRNLEIARLKVQRNALLEAAKAQSNFLGELNDCRYCGVIFTSRYGVDYKTEHAPDCAWRKLKAAIALAEKE